MRSEFDCSSYNERECSIHNHAFYLGEQHQQSKVDELQKKNAWLSDVACRENKRANKLQEENVNTTTLLGKTIQEKNELQKRVNSTLKVVQSMRNEVKHGHMSDEEVQMLSSFADDLEQALNGGGE